MKIKDNISTFIFRILLFIVIVLCLYYHTVNDIFFWSVIILSAILFLVSSYNVMIINQYDIEFNFNRLFNNIIIHFS